jgi:hypothetical protein
MTPSPHSFLHFRIELADDHGYSHARFLEDFSILEDASYSAAAVIFTFPLVDFEGRFGTDTSFYTFNISAEISLNLHTEQFHPEKIQNNSALEHFLTVAGSRLSSVFPHL